MCSVVSLIINGCILQIVVAEVHPFYVCPDTVVTKYTHLSDILKSSELEIVDTSYLRKNKVWLSVEKENYTKTWLLSCLLEHTIGRTIPMRRTLGVCGDEGSMCFWCPYMTMAWISFSFIPCVSLTASNKRTPQCTNRDHCVTTSLSYDHITTSPHHYTTTQSHHHITTSLYHHMITSLHYHITTSLYHHMMITIIMSPHHYHHHTITSLHRHITTPPYNYIITSSHHHTFTSPHHHITTSPHHYTTSWSHQ